jgi:hypothetical protein
MEVIDNFLKEEDFSVIEKAFSDTDVPSDINWYFSTIVGAETAKLSHPNHFYFIHTLYSDHASRSDYLNLMNPLFKKLELKSLVRAKVNLFLRTEQLYKFDSHIDWHHEANVAILYINTCDGGTFIEGDNPQFVKSVRNRLLRFKTTTPHSSSTCTDKKFRMIINLNYF